MRLKLFSKRQRIHTSKTLETGSPFTTTLHLTPALSFCITFQLMAKPFWLALRPITMPQTLRIASIEPWTFGSMSSHRFNGTTSMELGRTIYSILPANLLTWQMLQWCAMTRWRTFQSKLWLNTSSSQALLTSWWPSSKISLAASLSFWTFTKWCRQQPPVVIMSLLQLKSAS